MTGKIDFIIITYCASLNKDTVQISNSNGPYFRLSNPYYLKLRVLIIFEGAQYRGYYVGISSSNDSLMLRRSNITFGSIYFI